VSESRAEQERANPDVLNLSLKASLLVC